MNRLWSRVGVRATAVALLAAGVAGGIYLGQGRDDRSTAAAGQVKVDDAQLLQQRQTEYAASRAMQRRAEGDAADKAADAAKTTAGKAHTLAQRVVADKKAQQEKKKKPVTPPGGPAAFHGTIPSSCNQFSGSRGIGCALMLQAGFKIDQFSCLDKLWKRESGWNYKASNDQSGAYGIPQALPGRKMAKFGDDWKTNPATQIKWGLDYIQGRYGTPCGAWSHSQDVGSY